MERKPSGIFIFPNNIADVKDVLVSVVGGRGTQKITKRKTTNQQQQNTKQQQQKLN